MKTFVWLTIFCLLLCGCSSEAGFETLGPVIHVGQNAPPAREMLLDFPDDAAMLTASGPDSIYTCGDYDLCLQVLPSGDICATIDILSGFDPEQLTVMESTQTGADRYDWSWTAAGESGDMICRAAVLDDGNYHYTLCVRADADLAGNLTQQWNLLFRSFGLGAAA